MDRVIDGAIIIVDEAHNLDGDCRDAASLILDPAKVDLTLEQLAEFKRELQGGARSRKRGAINNKFQKGAGLSGFKGDSMTSEALEVCVKAADELIEFNLKVQCWLDNFATTHRCSKTRQLNAAPIAESLATGVSHRADVSTLRKKLKEMRAGLIDLGVESEAVKSVAINDSEAVLSRFELLLNDGGPHYTGWYTLPDPDHGNGGRDGNGRGGRGGGRGGRGSIRSSSTAKRTPAPRGVLSLLCWSGSVAFEPVAKRSSSVLLTSGTLQPMHLLQTEFFGTAAVPGQSTGLQLEAQSPASDKLEAKSKADQPDTLDRRTFLQFSAPHFPGVSDNLTTLFVSEAAVPPPHPVGVPTQVSLLGNYEQRFDPSYLRALGMAIVQVAHVVPAGMLVYFPSTAVLQNAIQTWRAPCGVRGDEPSICQQLEATKRVFVEPIKATADEFDARLSEYKMAAEAPGEAGGGPSGAVLLAVLRGRSSEGLNFSHDAARAVVMVSIAFPPIHDIKVASKRSRSSGSEWYTGQAFKAANQAIGRLIRNPSDYGVLVLLDRRFATPTMRGLLPGWVQNARRQWHARTVAEMAPGLAAVSTFFAQKRAHGGRLAS